ncbi:hypothetical protein J0667_07865 [Methylomonas sp. WH-1]|uniref:hypothetical protein n=1 Tax=unclassified Methylomonas TaxID=2608980 RepID=UPI0013EE70BB|nr:hypothetical protein [Methylomonas sp. LW13]
MDTPVVVMANQSDWLDDGTRAEALLVVIQTFNSKFSKPPVQLCRPPFAQTVENL